MKCFYCDNEAKIILTDDSCVCSECWDGENLEQIITENEKLITKI